jgi:4-diphosphocytidyl-2-C-methyl-D-erythritol kinase
LLVPPIHREEKTRRAYAHLTPSHFTRGERTQALAARLKEGAKVREEDLFNAFDSVAFQVYPELEGPWKAFHEAGAAGVHLTGSGPAMFTLVHEAEGQKLIALLQGRGYQARLVRTIPALEALSETM